MSMNRQPIRLNVTVVHPPKAMLRLTCVIFFKSKAINIHHPNIKPRAALRQSIRQEHSPKASAITRREQSIRRNAFPMFRAGNVVHECHAMFSSVTVSQDTGNSPNPNSMYQFSHNCWECKPKSSRQYT